MDGNYPILDEIRLTQQEWLRLQDDYVKEDSERNHNLVRLLVFPALRYYRLRLLAEGSQQEMLVDFLPPRYGGIKSWKLKTGISADTIVAVKIYNPEIPSEIVVCLGAAKENGSASYNCVSDYAVKKPKQLRPGMAEGLAWMALCVIQDVLFNRPTVFHTQFEKRETAGTGNRKKNRRRQVQTVKIITIVPEELQRTTNPSTHRKINCPCWGVMGHWRTYRRTGKKVWIAPYAKGRERNRAASYHAKEYALVTEGGTTDA